jgi:hippurate hydrolase
MNTRYAPHCRLTDLLDAADSLRETRHQLHRNPELSFREAATSELVAARLGGWGWTVTRHVGGQGVVGTLKVGDSRRAVALRADMDALPMIEETGKPWASAVAGVMHACGHDGYTTMAWRRSSCEDAQLAGIVHLVPAGRGSRRQRRAADDRRWPVRALPVRCDLGMHNHPGIPPARSCSAPAIYVGIGHREDLHSRPWRLWRRDRIWRSIR